MVPVSLLKFSTSQGRILPHYLDERDTPWLGLLWEEYLRFVGRPKIELQEHLTQLPFQAPAGKRQLASYYLSRVFRTQIKSKIPPIDLRSRLFLLSASRLLSREETCQQVATELGITSEEIERSLYADLPDQRCLKTPSKTLPPNALALQVNLMLIQGLLGRARSVDIELTGNSSSVVRHAKRRGLICVIQQGETSDKMVLSLSGPYSLFRSTLLYGRVLGELVPVLSWCNEFSLSAQIVLGKRSLELRLRSGDPIFPSDPPKQFDSRLEARFLRTFLAASKNWNVIREPEPVRAGGTLIFPDFALRHCYQPERKWLLEIVGYWTPDYLRRKMDRLRDAQISNLILCISDELRCADGELPRGALIVHFHKTIDPKEILKRIE